ncbi:hypothetical protein [Streptomyces melanogenes]|uniref:Uncharacterized protein n=1 Tax=Streptomyces melanogenes TaxID=67326 RepID=A0ABZ1XT37_9ACTN|nr:hypothetical protein [Streptomyces melanogenes]
MQPGWFSPAALATRHHQSVDPARQPPFPHFSIGGVHPEHGWSEFSLEDAAVKQAGLAQAARTIGVADATKLGVRAFGSPRSTRCTPSSPTPRPRTPPPTPATLKALRDAGVETVLAR